jgi:hypothetical protein
MRGSSLAALTAGAVVLTTGTPAVRDFAARAPARIESVAWLHGCWRLASSNRVTEEQWMRPAGGTMLGVSRTVRRVAESDSTTEFEFLRLFVRDGKLVYAAHPSGQAPAEFTENEVGEGSIVFANPQHDFPQRIMYRARGADSVIARIEGTIGGNARGMDFRYRRVSCDPRPTSPS